MIYGIKIYKNWGGAGSNGEWSNGYHIDTEDALDSPGVLAHVMLFANTEKNRSLDQVIFSRAVVTQYHVGAAQDPKPLPLVVPLGFSGVVANVVANGANDTTLPLGLVVRLAHAPALGRYGVNEYRGMIGSNGWKMEGGNPVVTTDIGTVLRNEFELCKTAADSKWVIPATKPDEDGAPGRVITAIRFLGIGSRDRRNSSKKKLGSNSTTAAVVETLKIGAETLIAGLGAFTVLKQLGKWSLAEGALEGLAAGAGTTAAEILAALVVL